MDYFHLRTKLQPNFSIVIPFLKFEKELERELLFNSYSISKTGDHFFKVANLKSKPLWAQDYLPNCEIFKFEKKSEVLNKLKSFPNLGCYLENGISEKQAEGILKEIRSLKIKRIEFATPSNFNFKYFVWTLLDENTICICAQPSSQFPMGWHEFNENKEFPPNRAYLKLWEALTLNYIQLKPEDVVLDLGSCPGGWSWVLSQQVSRVYSIDKAPLDPKISKISNIEYHSEDAFAVKPERFKNCTWLFSDIICTPERLLTLIQDWQQQIPDLNFLCTIKFKGSCDFEILKKFKEIPNSKIIHLYQNKNEVTWIKQVK